MEELIEPKEVYERRWVHRSRGAKVRPGRCRSRRAPARAQLRARVWRTSTGPPMLPRRWAQTARPAMPIVHGAHGRRGSNSSAMLTSDARFWLHSAGHASRQSTCVVWRVACEALCSLSCNAAWHRTPTSPPVSGPTARRDLSARPRAGRHRACGAMLTTGAAPVASIRLYICRGHTTPTPAARHFKRARFQISHGAGRRPAWAGGCRAFWALLHNADDGGAVA